MGADAAPKRLGAPPAATVVIAALVVAAGAALLAVVHPAAARASAEQDWPPFVLVAGLLLVGVLAQVDGLFAATGQWLGGLAERSLPVYAGAASVIAGVTAVLNLDTSVAFLTPILLYTARSRGEDERPLLYACLLLSNAASFLLPGSNLTNLIVTGHLNLSGRDFVSRMSLPFLASVGVTAVIVALVFRQSCQGVR